MFNKINRIFYLPFYDFKSRQFSFFFIQPHSFCHTTIFARIFCKFSNKRGEKTHLENGHENEGEDKCANSAQSAHTKLANWRTHQSANYRVLCESEEGGGEKVTTTEHHLVV